MHCSPVHPGTWKVPVSFIVVAGVIAPVRKPASAVTSLNVEPGRVLALQRAVVEREEVARVVELRPTGRSGCGLVNSAGS